MLSGFSVFGTVSAGAGDQESAVLGRSWGYTVQSRAVCEGGAVWIRNSCFEQEIQSGSGFMLERKEVYLSNLNNLGGSCSAHYKARSWNQPEVSPESASVRGAQGQVRTRSDSDSL